MDWENERFGVGFYRPPCPSTYARRKDLDFFTGGTVADNGEKLVTWVAPLGSFKDSELRSVVPTEACTALGMSLIDEDGDRFCELGSRAPANTVLTLHLPTRKGRFLTSASA